MEKFSQTFSSIMKYKIGLPFEIWSINAIYPAAIVLTLVFIYLVYYQFTQLIISIKKLRHSSRTEKVKEKSDFDPVFRKQGNLSEDIIYRVLCIPFLIGILLYLLTWIY